MTFAHLNTVKMSIILVGIEFNDTDTVTFP